MRTILDLVNIFQTECTYNTINKLGDIQLRNKKNGIAIEDAILYKFLYAELSVGKESIVTHINKLNNTFFTRQSFEEKENNISIHFYKHLSNKVIKYYNDIIDSSGTKIIAVDGTYNNDDNRDLMMNLGIYDVTNDIPINITCHGKKNRNKEVKLFKKYISSNIKTFKDVIFVADRLYFQYDLLEFLNKRNLKYIIRVKGNGHNLDQSIPLKKNVPRYDLINKIRSTSRLIKYECTCDKTLYAGKNKGTANKLTVQIKNNYVLVTNLQDSNKYTDNIIINHYKTRWNIEVFFKFMKSNFKFQHMNEHNSVKYQKLYYCELIISHIEKILEQYIYKKDAEHIKNTTKTKRNGKKVECTNKINKSHLVRGIFDTLLYNIFHNNINKDMIDRFYKLNVKFVKNELNRSFIRNSKTPFSKWYIKGYSELTKYQRIIDAIENNTVDKLDKNLKTLANRVTVIK